MAMKPGQDLVAAGYIALHGTAMIAREREPELLKRFSSRFVEDCRNVELQYGVFEAPFAKRLSLRVPDPALRSKAPGPAPRPNTPESVLQPSSAAFSPEPPGCPAAPADTVFSALWRDAGASDWMAAGEGGVLAALWHFFEPHGLGFDLELRALPIRQETVEVCERFDLNPYRLHSGGCVLLIADNGGDAARRLKKAGIHAAVVGKTAKGPGKRIHNGEVHSFLNRPEPDELNKVIM